MSHYLSWYFCLVSSGLIECNVIRQLLSSVLIRYILVLNDMLHPLYYISYLSSQSSSSSLVRSSFCVLYSARSTVVSSIYRNISKIDWFPLFGFSQTHNNQRKDNIFRWLRHSAITKTNNNKTITGLTVRRKDFQLKNKTRDLCQIFNRTNRNK